MKDNTIQSTEQRKNTQQQEEDEVKIKKDDLEELLDSTIEENESGIRLFKAMNDLKVFKKILLKPRHEALIPVLTMHLKKMERIKNSKNGRNHHITRSSRDAAKPKKTQENSKMTLKEAFNRLGTSPPENQVESLIDEFMKTNLSPYFGNKQTPYENTAGRPLLQSQRSMPQAELTVPSPRKLHEPQKPREFFTFEPNHQFEEKEQESKDCQKPRNNTNQARLRFEGLGKGGLVRRRKATKTKTINFVRSPIGFMRRKNRVLSRGVDGRI